MHAKLYRRRLLLQVDPAHHSSFIDAWKEAARDVKDTERGVREYALRKVGTVGDGVDVMRAVLVCLGAQLQIDQLS